MNISELKDALESSGSLVLCVQFSDHLTFRAKTGINFVIGCSELARNPTGHGF